MMQQRVSTSLFQVLQAMVAGVKLNTYQYVGDTKGYVWPIPQSAITASKGVLTQNPLWK
jgi:hypothetical protein